MKKFNDYLKEEKVNEEFQATLPENELFDEIQNAIDMYVGQSTGELEFGPAMEEVKQLLSKYSIQYKHTGH